MCNMQCFTFSSYETSQLLGHDHNSTVLATAGKTVVAYLTVCLKTRQEKDQSALFSVYVTPAIALWLR